MRRVKKPEPPEVLIKNTQITSVDIKVSWEPSCRQLVTVRFSDPDGTMTHKSGTSSFAPKFTFPFFKAEGGCGAAYIGASLLSLAWVLDSGMYLNAVGQFVRVKFSQGSIKAIGHLLYDRWISDEEGLKNLPYPYCLNKDEVIRK